MGGTHKEKKKSKKDKRYKKVKKSKRKRSHSYDSNSGSDSETHTHYHFAPGATALFGQTCPGGSANPTTVAKSAPPEVPGTSTSREYIAIMVRRVECDDYRLSSFTGAESTEVPICKTMPA
jgi:hypothetical protein